MNSTTGRMWDTFVANFVFGGSKLNSPKRRRSSEEAALAKEQEREAKFLRQLDAVTDPAEALRLIVKHEHFLTLNREYAGRRAGLLGMADRIAKAARRRRA